MPAALDGFKPFEIPKGCVRYIFASLFLKSKQGHLSD